MSKRATHQKPNLLKIVDSAERIYKCSKMKCKAEQDVFIKYTTSKLFHITKHIKNLSEAFYKDNKISEAELDIKMKVALEKMHKLNQEIIESLESTKLNECNVTKCQKEIKQSFKTIVGAHSYYCKVDKRQKECNLEKLAKKYISKPKVTASDMIAYKKIQYDI